MTSGQCQKYLQEILKSGVKFGLNNVRTVLASLGRPHLAYPSVLVAGTNGKGSVCAMLAKILSLHGLKVGLYTSPHLVAVEERIRIGEDLISPREFCFLLGCLKRKFGELIGQGKLASPPTYFETLTCLALLYFQRQKVDIAILEVGMGGRLDATNVITPLLSVITTISRDHEEYLGRTLVRIAREKAGIIKPGVPVICSLPKGRAYNVIKTRAKKLRAPFVDIFAVNNALTVQEKRWGHRFFFAWSGRAFSYAPALLGEHQGRNAAVAIVAALEIGRRWKPLDEQKILQGIKETRWPGRLEIVSRRPLVTLDGAHNEEGARALESFVRRFLPKPLTLVFGMMKDKEIRRAARLLFPLARKIILTTISSPRAASAEMIFSLVPIKGRRAILVPDLQDAVRKAFDLTPRQGSILITGSLFLVGEFKKVFPLRPKPGCES
jgi:dihydrofolate synthase/folylpolyglutamate synthase